jgi:hypothetical protein
MSHRGRHIEDYLAMRRVLGFKQEKPGRLLRDFAAFTEAPASPGPSPTKPSASSPAKSAPARPYAESGQA